MVYLPIIFLLLAGILGAAGLIVGKKPEAKAMIDKLAPFQGIIGVITLGWGVYGLINILLNLGNGVPVFALVAVVVMILLGALLGFGLIKTFIKDGAAVAKLDEKLVKVAPFQGILGLVGIGLAVWSLIQVLRV